MALHRDLREFIELLNSNGVDYLIVGAHALAFHGHPRYTGDVDILVRVSEENALKLEHALSEFGFEGTGLRAKDFMSEGQVIQLGVAPNRIDILTSLTGVPFEEAWEGRVSAFLDGIAVCFLGREQLIRNKEALGRPKDIADIEQIGGTRSQT